MGAGHYSSPEGGGGVGIGGFWFFYDQLYLITPIRLCNILSTPTPTHPAHTQHTPTHTHTHARTHKKKTKKKLFHAICSKQHAYTHWPLWTRPPLARLFQPQHARQKLRNVQFRSLFFQLQAMQKRTILEWSNYLLKHPGDFHGHYVQLLIRAWKFIYRLHVQVRWAEHILWTIFLLWRSKIIFHDTSERL